MRRAGLTGAACVAGAALLAAVLGGPAGAAYPGRNGLIATVDDYTDRGGGVDVILRLLDRRGKPRRRFSRCQRSDESSGISGSCPADPAFFASGRRIAHSLGPRLAIQPVSGGSPVVLRRLTRRDADPYPSPDGRRLVFVGKTRRRTGLYIVRSNGTRLRRIGPAGARHPAWSSRGEIAFSANGAIWRMRPGGRPRRVASGRRPDWSPSGRAIVYTSGGALYRIPTRGGAPRRLVSRYAGAAAFSPDARRVAFIRDRDPLHAALFVARSRDGGNARRLRRGGELDVGSSYRRWRAPSWQPRR